MTHRSTRATVQDLRTAGRLIEITQEVDPYLEAAEIQRRVYANQGPAVLFSNLKGCQFPAVSNLFASLDQARYLFRHTLESVRRLIELKTDPSAAPKKPLRYAKTPWTAWRMLPKYCGSGPVMQTKTKLSQLPAIQCWPEDGGAFVTLPQVLSMNPHQPDQLMQSNLGMYRIQMDGNDYETDREIGLHYQIHRGMGVHHQSAMSRGEKLRVAITVGGAPAMSLAAVMPLPEGLSELTFGGALAGHKIRMIRGSSHAPIYADADFAIVGTIDPNATKPEGPFGDHLGYYSLQHPFPVMQVEQVWHRRDAIWPFTVVGRPPQEDTTFGQLIHEITDPIIPSVIPGVKAVHAVDVAGVHPLLLAIGSERYMSYLEPSEPQELLTQANAILGNGQLSLAKYLWICDDPDQQLQISDYQTFIQNILARVDWRRDLHFHTRTTIDTLDYSGTGFNRGSKVVIAATGQPNRSLATSLPANLTLPEGWKNPRIVSPGILAVESVKQVGAAYTEELKTVVRSLDRNHPINQFPLITVVDDSDFCSQSFANWTWVTFTRSNPAMDIQGIEACINDKHWGCHGSLVIDARIKPHHAPPLIEDPQINAKVDALAAKGEPISRYL
ncbi:MAG: UbiD family decarboxylase [Planctomycetota bacterium]|nr:UbiD family decarboxylase [Planctomycetota bacterium]